MPSIFIPMDSSGAWEIEDRRGKLRRRAASVISTPSNDSTFVTMMKRE
jgi:hypothetical protein